LNAAIKNEWLLVKEKSSRNHNFNAFYKGTLIELAQKIESNELTYFWYLDNYVGDNDLINFIEGVNRFYNLTLKIDEADFKILEHEIPQLSKLPTLDEFQEFVDLNDIVFKLNQESKFNSIIKSSDFYKLNNLIIKYESILWEIEALSVTKKEIELNDLKSNYQNYERKIHQSYTSLNKLKTIVDEDFQKNFEINYPENKSLIQLQADAIYILNYLKQGNSISNILFSIKKVFLNKELKERLYFIDTVKLNGSSCYSTSDYETVLRDLEIKKEFYELRLLWDENLETNYKPTNALNKFSELAGMAKALKETFDKLNQNQKEIVSISDIKPEELSADNIDNLKKIIEFTIFKGKLIEIDAKFQSSKNYLLNNNLNPIALEFFTCLDKLEVKKYDILLENCFTLNETQAKCRMYNKLKDELYKLTPNLTEQIINKQISENQLLELSNAIYHKDAKNKLTQILSVDFETELELKLKHLEEEEFKLVSEMAALKAWCKVLENLKENSNLRKHLVAWVESIKKIGKTGKGKRALKFRKEAQKHMNECKESIPCWIMPIYKVAETITPIQGMYDYVIVDEASQLGSDANFLLYISKKIIVVGDDKQTSPEYVGVNNDAMEHFVSKHLTGLRFSKFFGLEFSFFDQAKIFTDSLTVLREHFRCMPEIIEFCNKYFYAPEGKNLYPLKQYSENRLEPLQNVYCNDGFIEGTHQNIVNRVEANKIAEIISKLIKDPRYNGKTIGIITLQGNRQADIIENLVFKKIGEIEYTARRVVCGNSASFQGDERDIIFLSLITANNHKRMPLVKPEDERRFNVAVSRAKEQIWLIHSVLLDDLSNTNDLRYKLLDHFINFKEQQHPIQSIVDRTVGNQPEPFDSWFEVDVFNEIVSCGYKVIPQYKVAGGRYRIDLVVVLNNGVKIAIECDGDLFHGPEQFMNDLLRQRVLERCGWQFFRVRGADYYSNRISSLSQLWKILDDNSDSNSNKTNYTQNPKDNFNSDEIIETRIQNDSDESEVVLEKTVTYDSLVTLKIPDGDTIRIKLVKKSKTTDFRPNKSEILNIDSVSPFALKLYGKKVGDFLTEGLFNYEILNIE
jgi:transcription elongation GreA/GreB family factor/very-short-patch-repair endonuclease